MKLAIVQPRDVQGALKLTESALKEGAELVLLPEKWVKDIELAPLDQLRLLAKNFTAWIIPGAFEDGVSVVAPIFDSNGEIRGVAKKVHLFGQEKERLYPGDRILSFSFRGVKFGLLVCYDVDFPETVRSLFLKGVEVLLVPSKVSTEGMGIWRDYLRVRAIENRIAVVNANALDPPEFRGMSSAFVPVKKGRVIDVEVAASLEDREQYSTFEVDPLKYLGFRAERMREYREVEVDEI
ncbi:nitrilase [Sulfodiicoccus acidiphilus]|uniref:Nitrilase n=1 Tax=Sulfodiicoccus acidiphilus TaxID=1670455 RepID=A0A348B3P9_9CREN|nr:carbon-nitrogen hydrolase family protein [Sulfodiicoccus acidiphilus]BBD72801.1 nitrilase [Sulfodiicoccus acidiphilus]GGT99913.1 nitrilase [Sulfodiicoccus acidiphilus]